MLNNVKGFAVARDGGMRRMAITYDTIEDGGKVVSGNIKINRLITDKEVESAIEIVEKYAQRMADENSKSTEEDTSEENVIQSV